MLRIGLWLTVIGVTVQLQIWLNIASILTIVKSIHIAVVTSSFIGARVLQMRC